MSARIQAISYYLPETVYSNADFYRDFPESVGSGMEKIGVSSRRRVGKDESSSDLAYKAALQLFEEHQIDPQSIDLLILANLEPDYYTPPTSCVLHGRLDLKKDCGVFEFNHGCSAYVYGLAMAEGMIASLGIKNVLFLTSSTLSHTFHKRDRSSHFVFGDAASATLIQATGEICLGPYEYGTDGKGFNRIIVEDGNARNPLTDASSVEVDDGYGNITSRETFRMDGVGVFLFTMRTVPPMIENLLRKSGMTIRDIDYFVFHQPNRFLNETLRKKIGIPEDKFVHDMEHTGNTVQATIPIALKHLDDQGKLKGKKVLLAGFGVGLSWISTIARF